MHISSTSTMFMYVHYMKTFSRKEYMYIMYLDLIILHFLLYEYLNVSSRQQNRYHYYNFIVIR